MDLTAVALRHDWLALGWGAALPVLVWAFVSAPWRRLAAGPLLHVLAGGVVCQVVLWTIRATIADVFTFHLLGVTGLALAVGPRAALAGTALAVALHIGVHGGHWANAGIAFVTMAAIPVATGWTVHVLGQRFLPPNLFVYVFVGAFFGAGLALIVGGLAAACALAFGGGVPADTVFGEYVPYLIYLGWGEAVLTGMALTLMVVYRPQWVTSFDDDRYLRKRP
jgi:uncharacterized membrane protein